VKVVFCAHLREKWIDLRQTKTKTGARELSKSCVSQNSGSLETEQPCVLAHGGGSWVSPTKNVCNLWANMHSEPFPGQNELQNYMQSWTCVWTKFFL